MLMSTAIILAAIATALALFLGVRSMTIGGTYDRDHSGQWMSARVVLQAVTIALVILAVYLAVL